MFFFHSKGISTPSGIPDFRVIILFIFIIIKLFFLTFE